VPFVRPPLPELDKVVARLTTSYEQGTITNGPLVAELEARAAERLGTRHVVAVSSATTGLMLAIRALGLPSGGAVLLPSFTFSASAHAIAWNGLRPVFADCDRESFQLDVNVDLEGVDGLEGVDLDAILATHVFGAPCSPEAVEALAATTGARVVFDAAAAFGSTHAGRPIGGFGDVEVFSLTPTKTVIAGEGGLVSTDDDDIAKAVRIGREYGNPGDYNTQFVGLNGRMSELHAALALESFANLDAHLARRRAIAGRYVAGLAAIPGVRCQQVDPADESTWKDVTIVVEPDDFGMDRSALQSVLLAEGVQTRTYFHPPVHHQTAYEHEPRVDLPVTDALAARVLSLPISPSLPDDHVDRIVGLVTTAHESAEEVAFAITESLT
jgi:dTDP-4-amino-4,6-dideoxygalactose transaminase